MLKKKWNKKLLNDDDIKTDNKISCLANNCDLTDENTEKEQEKL